MCSACAVPCAVHVHARAVCRVWPVCRLCRVLVRVHVLHRRHAPDRVGRVDLLGEDGEREAADALISEVFVQQLSSRAQRQRGPSGHAHLSNGELRVAAQLQRAVDRDDSEVGQQPVEVAADRVVERDQQRAHEQQEVQHSRCRGSRAHTRSARCDY